MILSLRYFIITLLPIMNMILTSPCKATDNSNRIQQSVTLNQIENKNENVESEHDYVDFISKQRREYYKQLSLSAVQTGTFFIGMMAMQYMQSDENKSFDFYTAAWNAFGGTYFISSVFSSTSTKTWNLFAKSIPSFNKIFNNNKDTQSYDKLLRKYYKSRSERNDPYKINFEKLLKDLNYYKDQDNQDEYNRILKILKQMLKLPTKIKPFNKEKIINDLPLALKNYPQNVQETVLEIIEDLTLEYEYPVIRELNYRKLVYLLGSPGVGKTYMVKLISEVLKHPFYSLSLDGMTEEKLNGKNLYYNPIEIGALTKILIKSKCTNPIVLIDEADKYINTNDNLRALILSTCSESHEYHDNTFDIPINISQIIVIATGNKSLSDPGFARRFLTLRFNELTSDQKYEFAQTTFKKLCILFDLKFNEEDQNKVEQTLRKIVDEDKNPGVAVLQKVVCDFTKRLKADRRFDRELQPFNISAGYRKYQEDSLYEK